MSRFDCCQNRTSFVSRNSQPFATTPCSFGSSPVRSVAWAVQVTAGSTSGMSADPAGRGDRLQARGVFQKPGREADRVDQYDGLHTDTV